MIEPELVLLPIVIELPLRTRPFLRCRLPLEIDTPVFSVTVSRVAFVLLTVMAAVPSRVPPVTVPLRFKPVSPVLLRFQIFPVLVAMPVSAALPPV